MRKDTISPSSRPGRPAAHLDVDHSISDQDQTAADADQTASDSDQSSADRDQAASEADQRASDEDQGIADRELEAVPSPDPERLRAHDRAHTDRGKGTIARMTGTAARSRVGSERDENARRRDGAARRRDELAVARDLEAERLEDAAERMAEQFGKDGAAVKVAIVARASAAAARDAAARDRERAAADRDDAARDRELLIGEIQSYDVDESTDTYGRRFGEVLLRHEVKHALSTGASLSLAVLSVNLVAWGDPDPNNTSISTEDRDLAVALRARLGPLDSIVRWDEGEFVCAITTVVDADIGRLLGEAVSDFTERHPGATLEIGRAAAEKGDSLDGLIERVKQGSARRQPRAD